MKSYKYYLIGIMVVAKRLCGDYGMKYRIQQYRELGAKIGGSVRLFHRLPLQNPT